MQTYPPSTRIGQYEIASRPMKGGMGVVYFALDHGNDGRPVALKTFRPELLPDRAARDRFLREGTAWVELGSHLHIVRCYKVEYIDPTAFLVLELITKEQNMLDASLRSWLIPGHPLPLEQALLFALQIARGMQHATEKIPGFVHRDLKPENILVGVDRLPDTNINLLRVTDFGLATMLKGEIGKISDEVKIKDINRTQLTQGPVGTPVYMAPEQWKGELVGVFTDVYAFGCILYEMLVGFRAVEGKTITELKVSHCDGRIRETPANFSKDVADVLARCLTLNSYHRYQTWAELTYSLEGIYVKRSNRPISREPKLTELTYKEKVQTGLSYNAIGLAYKDIGKTDLAVRFFKQALVVGKNEQAQGLLGAALGNLGLVFTRLGNVHEAIRFYEQAHSIAQKIGLRRDESASLINLGTAHATLGDFQQAISFYQEALKIYLEIGDARGVVGALGSLGNAYANLSDTTQAIQSYEKAFQIASKIGDRRGEGASLGNLGSVYMEIGEFPKAIGYLEQCLAISREIGDLMGEGAAFGNLGITYKNLGETTKAIAFHELALKIHKDVGDRHAEGRDLVNLGNANLDMGDIQKALMYYEENLIIQRDIGNPNKIALTCYNLAHLFEKMGDRSRSLENAQEALQIFTRIGNPMTQQTADLISRLQSNLTRPTNPIQPLLDAFISASSLDAMRLAVTKYPFMLDESFIDGIKQSIDTQLGPKLRPLYEQRLALLKQLSNK